MQVDPVLAAYLIAISSILFAAIHDIAFRLIPDWCVVVVAVIGLALRLNEGVGPAAFSFGAALALFVFFTAMFHFGIMGGGDVKLMSAASLLFPLHEVPSLFVWISFAGGVLALGKIVHDKVAERLLIMRYRSGRIARKHSAARVSSSIKTEDVFGFQGDGLPYGAAIFFGTLVKVALTT